MKQSQQNKWVEWGVVVGKGVSRSGIRPKRDAARRRRKRKTISYKTK